MSIDFSKETYKMLKSISVGDKVFIIYKTRIDIDTIKEITKNFLITEQDLYFSIGSSNNISKVLMFEGKNINSFITPLNVKNEYINNKKSLLWNGEYVVKNQNITIA